MGSAAVASRVSKTPEDYAELHTLYRGYVENLVRKLMAPGTPSQDIEDVTSTIFTYLIKADILAQYDPEHTATTSRGDVVKCSFRTFLNAKVSLYVKGQRDKLQRQGWRESLVGDNVTADGDSWFDLLGGSWFDDYDGLDGQGFIERMRTWLALQDAPEPGQPGLLALFDELVREVRETGSFTRAQVCRRLGIRDSVAKGMIARLRGLSEAGPPVKAREWVIGGIRCGIPEILEAIRILDEATSIMVLQPLRKAGHPLKDAAKGWYHPFSADERKRYPHLEIDPETHRKPAGHVKLAVIHRLRRMVAEASSGADAPVRAGAGCNPAVAGLPADAGTDPQPERVVPPAAPEEPLSPLELIEFEVRQLGADNDKVAAILALVEQAAA